MIAYVDPEMDAMMRKNRLIVGYAIAKRYSIEVDIGSFYFPPLAYRLPHLCFNSRVITFVAGGFIRTGKVNSHQAVVTIKIHSINPQVRF